MKWDAPLSLLPVQQVLDSAVRRWPDQLALGFMGCVITYRELGELVNRATKGFQAIAFGTGVHAGSYLPNTPHCPVAFFGVLKAGGTVVNYSPLDAERVLAHKVSDSETDVLDTLDIAVLFEQLLANDGACRPRPLGNLRQAIVGPAVHRRHHHPAEGRDCRRTRPQPAARCLPLADIKAMAKRSGASLKDIVLAVCAGALKRYFDDHNVELAGPLVAGVPISLREAGSTDSNNQVSMMIVGLCTAIAGPLERLQATRLRRMSARR